ncbi:putative Nudix hydrolase family protein, putative pyrophosphohydrolase [Methylorubrum extorquens]|uniref:Putative Nudix hydrolase family protein, putative pyrophosphohydrolase n=1 Tax=Methylorubrum extorquens TaxID=408 RepID=A0A2N9AUV4_METEX|nr:NUDIX domain-containing protein [Methylorubrum zatmanii]ARO55304.1 NUDIX hydrolase [Methylorubrum zatmanii]SOR31116.1 putative Nudix hydrolase family protein, putative pyrophosphohydrolase [Methylorubrum extorquens]
MTRIRVAALALTRRDETGEALLVVRKRGSLRFMLPGGKFEADESDAACLARELREELALAYDARTAVRLGQFEAEAANEPGHIVEATVYRQGATPGLNPVCGAEIEEIRWLSLSGKADPSALPLAPLLTGQFLALLSAASPTRSASPGA